MNLFRHLVGLTCILTVPSIAVIVINAIQNIGVIHILWQTPLMSSHVNGFVSACEVKAEIEDIWNIWIISYHGTRVVAAQSIVSHRQFLLSGDTCDV